VPVSGPAETWRIGSPWCHGPRDGRLQAEASLTWCAIITKGTLEIRVCGNAAGVEGSEYKCTGNQIRAILRWVITLNCADQQLTGKNGMLRSTKTWRKGRGLGRDVRSEWQEREIAARARWHEDISRVDAFSSTYGGLVLLWHASELHCQLLVHS
jgi:hypothetical protein